MLKVIVAMLFWAIWGAFENRAWKEHGENWILGHFKTYHAVMGAFYVAIASLGADSVWQFLFLLAWAPLALDVVWWLIRYWDFQVDPVKATESYGEPNAWHSRDDWDNWLGLPLMLGCYWWWWACLSVLVVLGGVILCA
jgi:hypothetical protein